MTIKLPAEANIPTQEQLTLCGPTGDCNYPRDIAHLNMSEDGVVTVTIDYMWTQNPGVSFDVWHERAFQWALPDNVDREELVFALSPDGDLARLLARLHNGLSVGWDGSNQVGNLTDDASNARYEIEQAIDALPQSFLAAWTAEEWLYGGNTMRQALDCCDLTVDATDAEIFSAAEAIVNNSDNCIIRGGVDAAVAAIRKCIESERDRIFVEKLENEDTQ